MRSRKGTPHQIFVTGQWAFLPTTRAGDNRTVLYVRVPSCVVYAPCHHCKADIGERCKGSRGWLTGVHIDRKRAGRARLKRNPTPLPRNLGPVVVG